MILSFKCADTQALFETGRCKKFTNCKTVAERKLTQLDTAVSLDSLRAPPGNRLEALVGNRKDSTAFASTINGEYVLSGQLKAHPMLRSWIIADTSTLN
jgi:toxin HigB-1